MQLSHGELGRGNPAEGFVGSFMVVAVHPFLGHVIEIIKPVGEAVPIVILLLA